MGREKRSCQGKQHFSHPHILKLIMNPALAETLTCNACKQPNITTKPNFYGCNSCQRFLHENCLNASRFLDHSSHPSHHLTLLPVPTYSNCSYTCKACGSAGNGFSFSCAPCEFDIHLQCALLPQTVVLPQHPHELELIFESPFDDEPDESTIFVCDICHDNADLNYWLYYCADCDFGTHLECAISKSVSQQERKLLVNKPRPNPVVLMKKEGEPIKIQEINYEDVDEKEEAEEEEEEEEVEDKEEEEEEDEDEDEDEEEEELKIPRSILIDKHPHELELLFGSPYEDKDITFACDICNIIMDRAESLYYCADCDFGSHLQCACPDSYDAFPTSQQSTHNLNPNPYPTYPNQNPKYPILNPNPTVEMINSVNDAHEQLIAAQIESQIAARGRQAMLDSIDGPSGRYYYC
ncbi:uncharacterized protein LOC132599872 [Lycium barbarum]|uniref:uncharacterized protein LOC132599872 n=1 Tax=Lycium barbarum TaxID=112863 RepID=UPI00293E24C5|nr:uncharacterized protein LOC132599872 [Lycium barbarum]